MGVTSMKVSCVDQRLVVTTAPVIASGGRNENEIIFTFCPLWSDFAKVATFYRDEEHIYSALIENNRCVIPWEVLADDGEFFFSIFGVSGDITRTSEVVKYKVIKGAITEVSDPTPDIYEQILDQLRANEELVRNSIDIANEIHGALEDARTSAQNAEIAAQNAEINARNAGTVAQTAQSTAQTAQAAADSAVKKTGDVMTGMLRVTGGNTSGNVALLADSEGGTIRITSPDGSYIYEIDAFNNESIRIHTATKHPDDVSYRSLIWNAKTGKLLVGSLGVSEALDIQNGGTGAKTASGALINLGLQATPTELNHMQGVRGNVQQQIDQINRDIGDVAADALEVTGAASSVVVKNLVPNRILVSDGEGKISESPVASINLNSFARFDEEINELRVDMLDGLATKSPLEHEHRVSEITDFPAWSKANTKPTYSAKEVGAAPSSHTHSATDIVDGVLKIANGGTSANTAKGAEYNINGTMAEATTDVTDDSCMVFKYTAPSKEKGVFAYTRASRVWTWIRWKIQSVFGFSDSNVLSVGHGGTGANNAAGARSALGAMSKSGDTSTGDITISKGDPYIYLKNTSGGNNRLGIHWFGTSSNNNTLAVYDELNGRNLLSIKQDGTTTLNKPLPVESGGTGAKDANGAQKNLFAPLKISETTDILTLTNGFYHFEGDSKKIYNWPIEKENHKFELMVAGNRNSGNGYWYVTVMDMSTGTIYYNHYYWSEWKGWKKLSMTAV